MISHKLQTLTIYVITLNANSSAILNSMYSIVCIFIRSGAAFWATGDAATRAVCAGTSRFLAALSRVPS